MSSYGGVIARYAAITAGLGNVPGLAVNRHCAASLEKLARLKVLHPEIEGFTVTAGNACGSNDGAAALVVASDQAADRLGKTPVAIIRSWASVGVDPAETWSAPVEAIPKALSRAGLALGDVDVFEIDEAFASMCVACVRKLDIDPDKVNVNGSGTGVAAMCAGGGMGGATVIEVPEP